MHTGFALVLAFAGGLAVAPGPAAAVESDFATTTDPGYTAGRSAIDAKDWNAAITALASAEQREPRTADIQNLLGYAYRNAGNLELAFRHYERALRLDPRHLGAHEYIGEAYLLAKNLAKAEEHLAALRRLCPAKCEERDDLSRKIGEYRRTASR